MRDPSLPFLAVGFALFWALVGAYVMRLWLAHRRLARRLEELERRAAQGTG